MIRRQLVSGLAALALVAAGCGGTGGGGGGDADGGGRGAVTTSGGVGATTPPLSGTLTVLAASSLAESFGELGRRFQVEHPGLRMSILFGASSSLARQLVDGAPGDVLATADETTMGQAVEGRAVEAPVVFARNRLAIVTRAGNPEGLSGLADLAGPGLVVVLCAPEVPCGRLASEALAKAGVTVEAASLEENVKAVVSKVTLGEADAGIVYVTDVRAAGDKVAGVDVHDAHNVVAAYPLAVATAAANPVAARAWVDFALGPVGQEVLAGYGFAPATS